MNSYLHLHTFFERVILAKAKDHPFKGVKAEVAQLVEQLICNQLVGGSSPFFGSVLCSILYFKEVGEIVKRSTTTDCKSVLSEFEGSNPSLPTKRKKIRKVFLSLHQVTLNAIKRK